MQRLPTPSILAVAALGLAGSVHANDSAMGGTPTDLVPMESSQVRMLSEDILIREDGGAWEVDADYVFVNQAAEDVTLQVGFPEHRCGNLPGDEDEIMCVSKRPLDFKSMRTTVDGVAVKHVQGKLDPRHAWAPRLDTVWLYTARFSAGKQVRITHHYRVAQGIDSSEAKFGFYVTRTGATWAGSIGHARFRVHVPAHAFELYLSEKYPGLSLTKHIVEVDGAPQGEILLEGDDWNPEGDFEFGYRSFLAPWVELPDFSDAPARAGLPETERCPLFNQLWQSGFDVLEAKQKEPDAALVASYLEKGIGSARICRNMLFAVRGRRFADERLNRYFYGKAGHVVGSFPYAPFQPSSVFDEKLLTAGDWAALRLIDAIAKADGTVAPPGDPEAAVAAEPVREPDAPRAALASSAPAAPTAASPSGDCGCRVAPLPGDGVHVNAGLVLVTGLALACRRRRRAPPRRTP